MNQNIHPIPENLAAAAHIKRTDYQRTYAESVEDPDRLWACIGHRIDWIEEFSVVKDASYAEGGFRIRWLSDGKLDVERGDRVTIYLPMIPEMVTAALAGLQADGSLAHLGVHQRRLGLPRARWAN